MIDLKKVVIKEKKVDTILTKSNLPIAGYSINPYVGCPFGCEYCYATFMKRFTGHKEDWGMFLDIKMNDRKAFPFDASQVELQYMSINQIPCPIIGGEPETRAGKSFVGGFDGPERAAEKAAAF